MVFQQVVAPVGHSPGSVPLLPESRFEILMLQVLVGRREIMKVGAAAETMVKVGEGVVKRNVAMTLCLVGGVSWTYISGCMDVVTCL